MKKLRWYVAEPLISSVDMSINTSTNDSFITNEESQNIFNEYMYDSVAYLPYDNRLSNETNITNAKIKLQNSFNLFVSSRQRNIDMIYRALQTEYEPILNYDKKISGNMKTAHHKGTRVMENANIITTPNLTTTETTTPNTTVETTETPNTKIETIEKPNNETVVSGVDTTENGDIVNSTEESKVFGIGSTTGEDDKTVTKNSTNNATGTTTTDVTTTITGTNSIAETTTGTNKSKIETTGNNVVQTIANGNSILSKDSSTNYIDTKDISDTIYDHDIVSYEDYREYGNIGVTETATIIEKEIRLRLKSIATDLIIEFLSIYCASFSCIDMCEVIE